MFVFVHTRVHVCVCVCTRVCPCVRVTVQAGRFSCGLCVCEHMAVGVCGWMSVHTGVLSVCMFSVQVVCVCMGVPSGGAVCVCVFTHVCVHRAPAWGRRSHRTRPKRLLRLLRPSPRQSGASGPRECVCRSAHEAVFIFRGEEPGVESPSTCVGAGAVGQVDASPARLLAGPGAGGGRTAAHRPRAAGASGPGGLPPPAGPHLEGKQPSALFLIIFTSGAVCAERKADWM